MVSIFCVISCDFSFQNSNYRLFRSIFANLDIDYLVSITIQENVPLAPFTTLKIGGKARFFVSASSEDEVIAAFNYAKGNDLGLFVLGGGSNVLIADEGFDGLVLQVSAKRYFQRAGERRDRVCHGQGGRGLGRFCGVLCRAGPAGPRMPERHTRICRRNAGSKCRGLRAGGFRIHRERKCFRPEGRGGKDAYQCRLRIRLPHQYLQYG